MGKTATLTVPEMSDVLTVGSGFLGGLLIPNLVIDMMSEADESPYTGSLSRTMTGFFAVSSFGRLDIPQLIVILLSLTLVFVSLKYFSSIITKLGFGFVAGVFVRYLVLPYIGLSIPSFVDAGDANATVANESVTSL